MSYTRTADARVISCDSPSCEPTQFVLPYTDPAIHSIGDAYRAARAAGWLWSAVDLCPTCLASVKLDLIVARHAD